MKKRFSALLMATCLTMTTMSTAVFAETEDYSGYTYYNDDPETATLAYAQSFYGYDIIGKVDGEWCQAFFANSGLLAGAYVVDGSYSATVTPKYTNGGKALKLTLTLTAGENGATLVPYYAADTMVNGDDCSENTVDDGVLNMTSEGVNFCVYFNDTDVTCKPLECSYLFSFETFSVVEETGEIMLEVNPADLINPYTEIYDSSFIVYWPQVTLAANETRSFDLYSAIGAAIAHEHEWSFALSEDMKTISAVCAGEGNCTVADTSVTISEPSSLICDGTAKEASLDAATLLGEELTVEYYDSDDTALTAAPVNAGTYTAKVTAGGLTASVTYTLTKEDGSASVSMEGWTYGDEAKTPVAVSETNGSENVTFTYYDGETELDAVPEVPGTYTVKAVFAANDIYEEVTAEADFTIAKKDVTVTTKDASKAYGEADPALSAEVTGLVGNDTLVYTVTREAGENAGEYAILAEAEEHNCYNVNVVNSGKLTIEKSEANEITSLTCDDIKTTETPDAKAEAVFGEVSCLFSSDNENWDSWENVNHGTGTYYVKAVVEGTDNYNGCEKTVEFAVKTPCEGDVIVKFNELTSGEYRMFVNGVDTGVYEYKMTDCGYTIQNVETGMYVCLEDGKVVMRDSNPTVWEKGCGSFHVSEVVVTRYWFFGWRYCTEVNVTYLNAAEDGTLVASCRSGATHFAKHVVADEHSCHYCPGENNTHTAVCDVCGHSYTEACTFDESGHCTSCGQFDMSKAGVKNVTVSVRKGLFMTTAHIYVDAEGVKVSNVEVSFDGTEYTSANVYSVNKDINSLYVRVTDANGNVTNWYYDGSAVSYID